MLGDIIKAKTWDEIPPVLYDGAVAYSTRILEHKYREMEDAILAALRIKALWLPQESPLIREEYKDEYLALFKMKDSLEGAVSNNIAAKDGATQAKDGPKQ